MVAAAIDTDRFDLWGGNAQRGEYRVEGFRLPETSAELYHRHAFAGAVVTGGEMVRGCHLRRRVLARAVAATRGR